MPNRSDTPDTPTAALAKIHKQAVIRDVEPLLKRAVGQLPQTLREVAEYHFRWVDATGAPSRLGSRANRNVASMTMLCVDRDEHAWRRALNGATAVNLAVGGLFLHDDVIDDDRVRNAQPAAWTVFGVPAALMTGTALMLTALDLLAEEPQPLSDEIRHELSITLNIVGNGQVLDAACVRRLDHTVGEALEIIHAKTAQLASFIVALGPRLSGAAPSQARAAAEFGLRLGYAIQLSDDLSDLLEPVDQSADGLASDLRTRRVTAAVAHALQTPGTAQNRIRAYYQDESPPSPQQLRELQDLLQDCGAHAWLRAEVDSYLDRAVSLLPEIIDDRDVRTTAEAFIHVLCTPHQQVQALD
ncbi:polyprenyl synthetase family protein [Streptomyces sp. NPDC056244]|uniref:polyprenyl synthetase family protein n=1 Tax=Streptomyces sp. NPDC056244 TaxID=3345762 RepID=UPI0035D652FE